MFDENLLELVKSKNDPSLSRVVDLLSLLHERSAELNPDYPNDKYDSFSYLHALTASLEGTDKANQSCHRFIKVLREKLGLSVEESIKLWESIEEQHVKLQNSI